MPLRAVTIALFSVLALVLSACGAATKNSAKDFTGEKAAVADVIEQLEKAGSRGKSDTICGDILARSLVEAISSSGAKCIEEIDRAIEDADSFDLTVRSVTVSGLKATAKVEGKEKSKPILRTFELVKESGRWRASTLGAS